MLRCHYAHSPEVEDGRITAVVCEDTAAYKRVRIEVGSSVIDASGDGNVSDLAGAAWRMGREAKSEYNERIAPDTDDSLTMGTSVVVLVHKTDHEVKFIPPEGTPPFKPGYAGMLNFNPGDSETLQFFFPCETGGDIDTIADDHIIYDRLLKMICSAWNRIKNEAFVEAAKNWGILWISPRTGKRETRRFSTNPINMWRPIEMPAAAVLDWDESFAAGEVQLTFDTLERTCYEMPFECKKQVSDQCVKAFTVRAYANGAETAAVHVADNHTAWFA